MVKVVDWMNQAPQGELVAADRAILAWQRIQVSPTSIVLIRNGTPQNAQTMRLEYVIGPTDIVGVLGNNPVRQAHLFGVRNHASIPNTDIQYGDRFVLNGFEHEVIQVATYPGEVQAYAEVK